MVFSSFHFQCETNIIGKCKFPPTESENFIIRNVNVLTATCLTDAYLFAYGISNDILLFRPKSNNVTSKTHSSSSTKTIDKQRRLSVSVSLSQINYAQLLWFTQLWSCQNTTIVFLKINDSLRFTWMPMAASDRLIEAEQNEGELESVRSCDSETRITATVED